MSVSPVGRISGRANVYRASVHVLLSGHDTFRSGYYLSSNCPSGYVGDVPSKKCPSG